MEKMFKYWKEFVAMGGVAMGIFGWFYNQGIENQSLKNRVFDSPEQKTEHVIHVNNSVEEVEHYKALQTFDSVLKSQREYQKKTDKRRRKQDSLDLLDKTTIYQMKEAIEKINQKLETNN